MKRDEDAGNNHASDRTLTQPGARKEPRARTDPPAWTEPPDEDEPTRPRARFATPLAPSSRHADTQRGYVVRHWPDADPAKTSA